MNDNTCPSREAVLDALRDLAPELRRCGVIRVGLFGSFARNEAGPDSDIDVLVDLDPTSRLDLWGYAGLKILISDALKARFGRSVDVVNSEGLRPYVRPSVERDLLYAG